MPQYTLSPTIKKEKEKQATRTYLNPYMVEEDSVGDVSIVPKHPTSQAHPYERHFRTAPSQWGDPYSYTLDPDEVILGHPASTMPATC
jgi:hypothetical protein